MAGIRKVLEGCQSILMKITPGDGRVSNGQGDEAEGGSDRDAYLLNHFPSHLPVRKRKIPEALPMPPLSTSGMKSLPEVSWGGENVGV